MSQPPPQGRRQAEKRRPWHRRLLRRLGPPLATGLGPTLLRALAATWRVRRVGREYWDEAFRQGQQPVFALWHRDIPAGVVLHRHKPLTVLISRHRDGEIITRIVERLGYRTARGSTYDGAAAGLRAMLRAAREPQALVVTPDGPRGPALEVAPGILYLAAATGRPLMAAGFAADRAWRARSWDRMVLPKPFARVVVVFSPPFPVPREARREGPAQDRAREELAARLEAAAAEAARILTGGGGAR